MTFYLFLYFLLLIGAYVSKRSPFVLYFVLAIMALTIGFRGGEVGEDTEEYMTLYESLGRDGYGGYPEPIYGMLCEWGCRMGISFQVFQTLLTFFALCCTAFVIKRQIHNYCLSLFLLISMYFLFYTMNIYRELIACYISVLACYILFEEDSRWKRLKFVFLILFAAGFHLSALLLLSLLLIRRIRLRRWLIIGGLLVTLMIGIVDLANIFAPLLGGYEQYLDSHTRSGSKLLLGVFLAMYWILGFYFLFKNSAEDFRNSIYMKMFFWGIMVSNIFIRQDMGLRIMLYFTIPLIIGIPKFVEERKNVLLNQAIVIVYSSFYFFVFIFSNSANVVPYYID